MKPFGRLGRLALPIAVGLLVVVGTILLALQLEQREQQQLRSLAQARVNRLADLLNRDFNTRIPALQRMADRTAHLGGLSRDAWLRDAANLMADQPGYASIAWVDSASVIREQLGDRLQSRRIGLELLELEPFPGLLARSRKESEVQVAMPARLFDDSDGLVIVVPVFDGLDFLGYVIAEMRFQSWILGTLLVSLPESTQSLALTSAGERFHMLGSNPAAAKTTLLAAAQVPLRGTSMHVELTLDQTQLRAGSSTSQLVAAGGTLLAALLAVAIYIARSRGSALVARERMLREIMDNFGQGLALWDPDDRLVYWNEMFERLSGPHPLERGMSFETLVRANAPRRVAEGHADSVEAFVEQRLRQRREANEELLRQHEDVTYAVREVKLSDGSTIQTHTDITRLHEREARLQSVLDTSVDGILIYDNEDRLAYWNESFERQYPHVAPLLKKGIGYEPTVRHLLIDRGHDPATLEEYLASRVEAHRNPSDEPHENKREDGRTFWVREKRFPHGIVAVYTETTELRRQAAALEHISELQSFMLDHVDHGIALWDEQDHLVLWNQRYADMQSPVSHLLEAGLSFETLLRTAAPHRTDNEFAHDIESFIQLRLEQHRSGTRGAEGVHLRRNDGARIIVRDLRTESGRTVQILSDVTELERSEELLRYIIDNIEQGIALWGADDRLVSWNRPFEELMPPNTVELTPGLSFESMVRRLADYRARTDTLGEADTAEEFLQVRLDQHRNPGGDIERQRADGRIFLLREKRLPDGSVLETSTDITNIRAREDALRSILDNVGIGVALLDHEHRLQLWNELFEDMGSSDLCSLTVGTDLESILQDYAERRVAVGLESSVEAFLQSRREALLTHDRPILRLREDGGAHLVDQIPLANGGAIITLTDITALREQQQTLARRERELRSIVDNIRTAIGLYDGDDRIVRWNREYQAVALDGIDHEVQVGEQFEALVRNVAGLRAEEGMAESAEGYVQWRLALHRGAGRIVVNRADGHTYLLEETRLDDGGTLVAYHDITELQRQRDRIAERERELELVIDNAGTGIALWSASDRLRVVNEEYLRLTNAMTERVEVGDTFERFLSTTAPSHVPTGNLEDIQTFVRERMAHHRAPSGDRYEETADGTVYIVRAYPLPDGGTLETLLDVTELKARELQLRTILETVNDGIAYFDADDHLAVWNQAFETVLPAVQPLIRSGVAFETLVRGAAPQRVRHGEDADLETYIVRRMRQHRRAGGSRFELVNPRGEVVVVRETRSPEGGTAVVYTDITALKQREAELERSNRELEQFAYVASHDLQTPLRSVASFAGLLAEDYGPQLDDAAREYIEIIVDGAARMRLLITDLLEFSRIGRVERERETINLGPLIRQAFDGVTRPLDEPPMLRMGPLPTIRGSRHELLRLFENLVSNACKFRSERPLLIEVDLETRGNEWWIHLRDNGIGIEAGQESRIFEPFKRLHSREEYAGTGIGLAICRKIVEQHQGRIWLQPSEPERPGAHFVIALSMEFDTESIAAPRQMRLQASS
ncbi:MAG: PAS-domain containing protein [Gammaproteobacteria bacterium]|nr:PAS-domain containing protein [Gammaproteobacteria bacterium]